MVDDAFLRDSILNPTMHVTAGYAPIMPTYQGQVSEEGLIDLVEYIKALHSNDRVQQTLNTSLVQNSGSASATGQNAVQSSPTRFRHAHTPVRCSVQLKRKAGRRPQRRGWSINEHNASAFLTSKTATMPKRSYLNNEYGLKSWLLTLDHKRIGILYLFTTTFFFTIGGSAAALIRLNLLTPGGELVAADTYNKLFSIHGIIMVFFFLVPIAPAVLGNFLIPLMIGAKDVAFPRLNLLSWYLFIIGGFFEL